MRIFRRDKKKESGAIVIEATISLTFFIFTMFIIYSVVDICYVQARVNVALDYAAKDLSEYSYLYYKLGVSGVVDQNAANGAQAKGDASTIMSGLNSLESSVSDGAGSLKTGDVKGTMDSMDAAYESGQDLATSSEQIYKTFKDDPKAYMISIASYAADEGEKVLSRAVGAGIAKAFCMKNLGDGALTPDQFLRKYHVQGGVDGLDFSDTEFLSEEGRQEVDLKCNYTIEVPFSWWVEIPINFSAEAHTRAWGAEESKVAESEPEKKDEEKQEKSAWDSGGALRGQKIEEQLGKDYNYKKASNRNAQCDFFDEKTNTVINVTSIDPTSTTYLGKPNEIQKQLEKQYEKYASIPGKNSKNPNTIYVKDSSGNSSYIPSDDGSRKVKVILVIPDNADQTDVTAAMDAFKAAHPDATVEVNTSFGHASPKAEEGQ